MRRGQAMVETVLAVLFIAVIFFTVFRLDRKLTSRILLDHAAARAARARAVGFNDFMCRKSARVAMIPVAGKLLWPENRDFDEVSRVPIYLCTADEPLARGVLEYNNWNAMSVQTESGGGISSVVRSTVRMYDEDWDFDMTGKAKVESHFPLYMNDYGR